MTARIRRSALLSLVFLLPLPGCGDGGRVAEAGPARDAAGPSADSVYGAPAAANVRVVPAEVELRDLPAGWNGMRIAVLSDFELARWAENPAVAEAAVRAAIAADPDLIALLGDYTERGAELAPLRQVLAPLRGRSVVAVLGDDDPVRAEADPSPDSAEIALRAVFAEAGIRILDNERFPFAHGADTAFIAGIEPFLLQRPEWRQAEILGAVGGATVLLSHAPGVLARLRAAGRSFPLILAGDAGCGAVPPPDGVPLTRLRDEIVPSAGLPQDPRAFRVGQSTMLVTCGVGNSYVPVRLGAPPEVLLVTLRRAGSIRESGDTVSVPTVPDSLLRRFDVGEDSVPAGAAAG